MGKRFQVVLVFDAALLNVSKEHVVENAVVALVLPFLLFLAVIGTSIALPVYDSN